MKLDVGSLIAGYRAGVVKPTEIVERIYSRIEAEGERPIWITVVPRAEALKRARNLEEDPHALGLPLYGVPFAVKDNIDVAGLATTAGCAEFAYTPHRSATVVERLLTAGAMLVGKTNLDQFATGLVGVRSPYGACSSVYDDRYISGGSSSGSAVAVAKELVSFSLGTDTAGSGRVPAAFNNLVGLKPTRGMISAAGVLPACRSLDCVSVFASNSDDAEAVWSAARGIDPADAFSREPLTGEDAAPWLAVGSFRFGIPPEADLEFFGDSEARSLYSKAVKRLQDVGGQAVAIDFASFRAAAELLYSGPWVAERLAAVGAYLDHMHPVVKQIISGGAKYSAIDTFKAIYRLQELLKQSRAQWEHMDVLLLPTTGTIYTHDQIAADPIRLNSNLGYYTNFVNLLDLAAVAAPAGFRTNGLPFGITFIGPAFSDAALLQLTGLYMGSTRRAGRIPGCVSIAVVGAHLTGQPLNRELTARGARLTKTCRTAPGYRLFALRDTKPPKPGLVRDEAFAGPGVEVEVWSMPENEFGSFVASIPAPLGVGSVTLDDASVVKCFICEPYAITGSREITEFGGWRKYLAAGAR